MKLIINISETDYNTYKHFGDKGSYTERIIANGVPYKQEERPKGKWEYIGQSEVTGLKIVKCTNCHKTQYGSMNYCGNCGANMVADLCSICKHGDNCERSDKGISFANHSACWKFER